MKKPVVGITLDRELSGSYSRDPWYALRCNYFEAISDAGGAPFGLPYQQDLIPTYCDLIQALVIPGGFFDINPHYYRAPERHTTVITKEERTEFEFHLLTEALRRDLPLLGICAGAQLINVFLGGSLYQHIPDDFPNSLEHEQKQCRSQPAHPICIQKGTLLHRLSGQEQEFVNSTHHQAIKDLGRGVVVNSWAPDGVVEGIEVPGQSFCLGVEWHPEYHVSDLDHKIFKHLILAAQKH